MKNYTKGKWISRVTSSSNVGSENFNPIGISIQLESAVNFSEKTIAHIPIGEKYNYSETESIANSQLIANAPVMYEAIQEVLSRYNNNTIDLEWVNSYLSKVISIEPRVNGVILPDEQKEFNAKLNDMLTSYGGINFFSKKLQESFSETEIEEIKVSIQRNVNKVLPVDFSIFVFKTKVGIYAVMFGYRYHVYTQFITPSEANEKEFCSINGDKHFHCHTQKQVFSQVPKFIEKVLK